MKRRFSRFGSSKVSPIEEFDAAMFASSSRRTASCTAFQIAFRRRVDDLERDKIDFAHFYRTTIAGERHRLSQLLSDPRPKVDAALGPSFWIARLSESAVIRRSPETS
jgi:hypothetical protein